MKNKCNIIFDKLKEYMGTKQFHFNDMQKFCVENGMLKNTFKLQSQMRTINNPSRVKLGKNRDDFYLNEKGLYEVYKNQDCKKYYFDKTLTTKREGQEELIKEFVDYFKKRYTQVPHYYIKKIMYL